MKHPSIHFFAKQKNTQGERALNRSVAGFTLIEVIIGIALTGMISLALINSFFQSNRTLSLVEEYVDIDTVSTIVLHQIERDVAGIMIPKQQPKKAEKKEADKIQEKVPSKAEEKAKAPLTKIFYGTQKNKQLDMLSFLTVNPLAKMTSEKPRLVRVAYRLKENKERKGLFVLTRQETNNLDFDVIEKSGKERPRELVVSDMIKKCGIEFLYTVTQAEKENASPSPKASAGQSPAGQTKTASAAATKPPKQILKREATWDSDRQDKNNPKPLIPAMIKFDLTITDVTEKIDRTIEYHVPIYSFLYAQNIDEILALRKSQQPEEANILGIPESEFKGAIGQLRKNLKASKNTGLNFSDLLGRGHIR